MTTTRAAPAAEIAPQPTAERRRQLEAAAAAPLPWQEDAFRWIEGDPARVDAFRRLLLALDRYQDALRMKRLCRGGTYRGSVYGLSALAFHHRRWIRSPETWRFAPQRRGAPQRIDRFTSLARHLVARYPVPPFMDAAWFAARSPRALQQQEWFLHLAAGGSVRDLDLPVRLTRRMAHLFALGRSRASIEHHLRWVQVLGLGGGATLARAILATRLGRSLAHDDFWSTVVLFLANNPMIDPSAVGPIVDYIHHMRFAPRRTVRPDGGLEEAPPPQPGFAMKGRSATRLLRQVEVWHGHLGRVADAGLQSWQPCGLRPFAVDEEEAAGGPVGWTVQELLSSQDLAAEGAAMGHCVVSYANQCADGFTSIWSIGRRRSDEPRESILTVAVDVEQRAVTQARGRHNLRPGARPNSPKAQRAAAGGYLEALDRSDHILGLWAERERLRRED